MSKECVIISGIGGSGGSYLAEFLVKEHPQVEVHGLARWHSTTNLDNLKDIRRNIIVHECDLLDLPSIIRIFRKVRPKKIFNLASHANVRVCFDIPTAVLQNNILSMANMLEAVRLECPEALFQHCSTSEVYGNPERFPMTEEHPLKPVNPYAVSKLTQDRLAYAYYASWGLRVIITRMFAYINPRRRDLFASAFAWQVAEIEAGKRHVLKHGNLDSIRNIIDVRDAMRTYWMACDHCEPGQEYNIGGKTVLSVGEFLEKLIKYARVPIKFEHDKALLRPVDTTKQIPDTSKFDSTTKWKPKYTIDQSMVWLLETYRKELK